MKWHQGTHEKRYVYDEKGVGVAGFHGAEDAEQCVRDHNDALVRTEGRTAFQECGCLIGHPHAHRRVDTGGRRMQRGLGLPYAVGKEEIGLSIMRQFATKAEALAFIGTLPNHAGGIYFLDGPIRADDGRP